MDRAPTPLVPTLFGALALSAVIVEASVGHPIVLLACLAVGATAGWLGLVAAHRARPLTRPDRRPLTGGSSSPAAPGCWLPWSQQPPVSCPTVARYAMVTGLTALLLLGAGTVLGIAHLAGRARRGAAA